MRVTLKICEGCAHVQRITFQVTQVAQLQSLGEGLRRFLVAVRCLLLKGEVTLSKLSLASLLIQVIYIQTLRQRLGPEALQVVGDKGGTRKLLALGRHDFLGLLLGDLLQQSLESISTGFFGEAVDDAARSEVQQSLAVFPKMFIGDSTSIEGLDILAVHGKCCRGVLNDLLPLREDIVACRAIRIVNRVRLAKNGFPVQLDSPVVVFGSVRIVAGGLELCGVCLARLFRRGSS